MGVANTPQAVIWRTIDGQKERELTWSVTRTGITIFASSWHQIEIVPVSAALSACNSAQSRRQPKTLLFFGEIAMSMFQR